MTNREIIDSITYRSSKDTNVIFVIADEDIEYNNPVIIDPVTLHATICKTGEFTGHSINSAKKDELLYVAERRYK
jgi:predicted transcriptional regulator